MFKHKKTTTMKKLISAIFVMALFTTIAFAQADVKTEKAEIKTASKANTQQANVNKSEISQKEVKAENLAKTDGKIEVKESKAAQVPVAKSTEKAVITNPKATNQKAVERKAVSPSNTKRTAVQSKTESSPK